MSGVRIIGSFADDGDCARAIESLRDAKHADFNTFAPIPSHRIAHAIGLPKSRTRWISLSGGIIGVLTGLAVTIGTTYEWRLNAGGKPLLSLPAFTIICFELMILLGGIFGFAGFLMFAGIPATQATPGYDGRFAGDRFGLVVRCDDADAARVEAILTEAGGENIVREAATR